MLSFFHPPIVFLLLLCLIFSHSLALPLFLSLSISLSLLFLVPYGWIIQIFWMDFLTKELSTRAFRVITVHLNIHLWHSQYHVIMCATAPIDTSQMQTGYCMHTQSCRRRLAGTEVTFFITWMQWKRYFALNWLLGNPTAIEVCSSNKALCTLSPKTHSKALAQLYVHCWWPWK